jgi:hypothetical protein
MRAGVAMRAPAVAANPVGRAAAGTVNHRSADAVCTA